MVPLSGPSRGRRITQSNSPSDGANRAQSPSLNHFPFTFEYSIHSATASIQIEADVCCGRERHRTLPGPSMPSMMLTGFHRIIYHREKAPFPPKKTR